MVNEPFDHDDDGWPDPHVLAAWRVPTLPDEFADRVLAQAQFTPRLETAARVRARSHAPWIAGIAAALAMAAVLLLVFAVRSDRLVPPPVAPMQEPAAEPSVAGGVEIPTVTTSPLVVDVAPADATVIVDGHAIGGSSPFVVHHLAMGPHVVDVRRVGFVPRVDIIHIEGVPRRMALELAPLDVAAVVLPPGSTAARKEPRKPDLRRDLKDPFEGRRADDDGAGRSQDLMDPFNKSPAPAAKRTSRLRIGVLAGLPPARVVVDGAAVGTTPIASLRVTPGVHRIRWEWNDGRVFEQRIDVDDGETLVVKGG
jgi:hypothetical protein